MARRSSSKPASAERFSRWARPALAATLTVALIASLLILRQAWFQSELTAPTGSYRLLDRHGAWLADAGGPADGEYGYWPLDAVPPRVAAATLALEDRRFKHHPGVDALSVLRALRQNLACRCVRSGASTIAMQTVRLQQPAARTLRAKAVEALAAVFMTRRHGRDAVLRHYLRLVPYGNGSHGIAHAARMYLDKPVDELSWAEIALLSAVPRAPDRNNPLTPAGHRHAVARADRILGSLHEAGVIDAVDLDLARRQLPALQPAPRPTRPAVAMHAIIELSGRLGASGAAPGTHYSSLDLAMQQQAARHTTRWLRQHEQHGVEQLAVLVADRDTLAVRVLIGSADYHHSPAGAIDFSRVKRSPGSVLKPLIYALALDRGVIAPDTVLWDQDQHARGVRNADRRFLGAMLPRQALANSRNVPAVNLVAQTGLEQTYHFLGQAGLHRHDAPASRYGPGLAIGTLPASLREIVQAFGILANDGRLQPLRWFEQATPSPPQQLLGAAAARQVTLFLADPMVRLPTFARMSALEYPFPVAVKTGTSQDLRDAWTVAYTAEHIVGVWAGRADGGNMHTELRGLAAAALAREIVLDLHRRAGTTHNGTDFTPPPDHQPVQLCLRTGRPDDGHCPETVTEWLAHGPAAPRRAPPVAPYTTPTAGHAEQPANPRITRPASGTVYFRNPETPAELEHIRFAVDTHDPDAQVVWYVNGQPRATQPAARGFMLPMTPGRHVVQAALPFRPERSAEVWIRVRDY